MSPQTFSHPDSFNFCFCFSHCKGLLQQTVASRQSDMKSRDLMTSLIVLPLLHNVNRENIKVICCIIIISYQKESLWMPSIIVLRKTEHWNRPESESAGFFKKKSEIGIGISVKY